MRVVDIFKLLLKLEWNLTAVWDRQELAKHYVAVGKYSCAVFPYIPHSLVRISL